MTPQNMMKLRRMKIGWASECNLARSFGASFLTILCKPSPKLTLDRRCSSCTAGCTRKQLCRPFWSRCLKPSFRQTNSNHHVAVPRQTIRRGTASRQPVRNQTRAGADPVITSHHGVDAWLEDRGGLEARSCGVFAACQRLVICDTIGRASLPELPTSPSLSKMKNSWVGQHGPLSKGVGVLRNLR